jgi:hypothetical protein
MNRRELILVLGGAMTASRALRAQQKAMPVIGYLGNSSPGPAASGLISGFAQALVERGYGREARHPARLSGRIRARAQEPAVPPLLH